MRNCGTTEAVPAGGRKGVENTMMRSLFSGVSALKNHQIRMDVIGNNIANVNTVGFKSSRVTFRDILNQTLKAASSPQGGRGGINPMQIGLGMALGSIDVNHAQGSPEVTGRQTDMAIEGNGFFILSDGDRHYYTRAGLFGVDKDGSLISSVNGMKVMGWRAARGEIDPEGQLQSLVIPMGITIAPIATSSVRFSGNLDSRMDWEWNLGAAEFVHESSGPPPTTTRYRVEFTETEFGKWELELINEDNDSIGSVVIDATKGELRFDDDSLTKSIGPFAVNLSSHGLTIELPAVGKLFEATVGIPQLTQTVDVFDSLGDSHSVSFVLTKVNVNEWLWEARYGAASTQGTVRFDSTGSIESVTGDPLTFQPVGAEPVVIMPDFAAVVQNAAEGTLVFESQDGYPQGTLVDFSVDEAGNIIGEYSNGLTEVLGQIATAVFNNPGGLSRAGDTTYVMSANSGEPKVRQPGTGSNGKITPGSLEMSNVDLSQEFTDMIVTQRGFQANSRIITTSDEMLQELVNLKR